jgi:hypothetical protein
MLATGGDITMLRDYVIWLLLIVIGNLSLALHWQRKQHADSEALVRVMIPYVSWNPPEEFLILRLTNPDR